MTMAFDSEPRVIILPATAGLAVAFVRNILQYHRFSWDSWLEFLGTWLAHYVAVILIVGITYAFIKGKGTLLLGRSETLRKITTEEAITFGSILVIVTAVVMFLFAHWIPVDLDDE
jgi:hypothetical protein